MLRAEVFILKPLAENELSPCQVSVGKSALVSASSNTYFTFLTVELK